MRSEWTASKSTDGSAAAGVERCREVIARRVAGVDGDMRAARRPGRRRLRRSIGVGKQPAATASKSQVVRRRLKPDAPPPRVSVSDRRSPSDLQLASSRSRRRDGLDVGDLAAQARGVSSRAFFEATAADPRRRVLATVLSSYKALRHPTQRRRRPAQEAQDPARTTLNAAERTRRRAVKVQLTNWVVLVRVSGSCWATPPAHAP